MSWVGFYFEAKRKRFPWGGAYTYIAMPLPVIAGTVRCAISGSLPNGQPWTNVLHCRFTGGASSPGPTDIVALDGILMRMYSGAAYGGGTPWLLSCSNLVTLTKASYVILDGSALGQDISHTFTGGVTATTSQPNECAPVLTIRSAQRGRSHRGRVYLPVQLTNQIDTTGRMIQANVNQFITQVNGVKGGLGGPAVAPFWEMGVASYKLKVFTPVASFTMDLDVDVQRRRKN